MTIFVLGAATSWIIAVIVLVVFIAIRGRGLSQPGSVLAVSILREFWMVVLVLLILQILRKGSQKVTTSTKKSTSSKPSLPNDSSVGRIHHTQSSVDPIHLEDRT